MRAETTTHRHRRRIAASAVLAGAALVLVPSSPAAAHHGWDGFDTDHLVYIAGPVSSGGSWGDPHSYFDITLDTDLPAHTPDLEIPEDLQAPEDSIRVLSALAYDGAQDGLEVIIAPPWSGPWGLPRALEVGERFQAVGYINRTDDGLFRPVVFWWGDEDVPVNQVLGSTLPAHPPLPESAEATAPTPSTTAAVPDPLDTPAPSADVTTPPAAAASDEGGDESWFAWTAFGLISVAAVVGGFLYLRRRSANS